MLDKLTSPYAIEVAWKKDLWKIGFIALGIPLFLIFFQPFGIFHGADLNHSSTIIAVFGFGFICSIVTLLFWVILPMTFSRLFESFLLWQAICFFLIFLFTLASVVYCYVNGLQEKYEFLWADYFTILLRTFLIAAIPSVILFFYGYNNRLKSHLREATRLNEQLQAQHHNKAITIISENDTTLLKLTTATFLFAESADNYCLVHFLQNGNPKRETLRITLKRIESELKPLPRIVRCHRSYIVNPAFIIKVAGNSRGLQLSLKHVKHAIPVSRSYIDKIRTSITSQTTL